MTDPMIALIRPRRSQSGLAQRAFARQGGRVLSVDDFIAQARALAQCLPARSHVVNLCTDRVRFALGFAAALLRGQTSLLPPNQTPDLVARLKAAFPGVYCLRDTDAAELDLETMRYPSHLPATAPVHEIPRIPARQIAAIVFTSGSQGDPVPNTKTWGDISRSARVEAERLGLLDRSDLTLVGTVPAQHMYGFESTVLMAMQGGVMLDAAKPFYPADVASTLAAIDGPRVLVTTPVHLRALVSEGIELPALDLILCATAPLADDLAAAAEARFKTRLFEIYGCTEAGQIASRRTTEGAVWTALDGLRLRQTGGGAPDGVSLDGANSERVTPERVTLVSGGHVVGEIALGDVIELVDATRFRLAGRSADLINIAGKRTSLASLNHHLSTIEGVREGVFVLPDQAGDVVRLAALVVAPERNSADILHELRQRIDPIFLPRPLVKVDALPRNETGKLPRAALLRLLAQARERG